MTQRRYLLVLLVLLGAGWGITQPLAKIAVSEGYRHFGLIFWQFVIGVIVLTVVSVFRGKGLPLGPRPLILYAVIAVIGTIIPNSTSFESARHLPAGILSILMSTMPMFAFPIAMAMRTDTFGWPRLIGLTLGLLGVLLLVGPEASLPDRAMVVFVPLAMIAPFFYAVEGNVVAKWGTFGCDAVQVLMGASIIGAILTAPLAVVSGQWINPLPPWHLPDYALILSSTIHVLAYTSYVWLVSKAGSVFAAQVAYLVTAFGIFWSMVILSETYSNWIWAALGLIFIGLFLVLPRPTASTLAENPALGKDSA